VGAAQTPDVKAVDPDQLAGPVHVDMALGPGVAWRLIRRGVASDQAESLGARVQAVAAQNFPDAVGRDNDPAPLRPRELGCDALGPQPRMRDREAHDALLDHLRQLVGHLRAAALARAQHLEPVTVDLALPCVIRRAMHPEGPARMRDRRARREIKQLQAIAEQHVILRHAALLHSLWR
jgi:hypothetical protein